MRGEIFLGIFIIGILNTFTEGKQCPGYCTKDLGNCTSNFGKIVGYCTNEMACCDQVAGVTGSCGSSYKRLNTTYFKSPHFPKNTSGDLNCEFKLKLNENSIGIRIDFLQFETDGLSFGQGKTCDSDMFFIRGFETWAPSPRCGKLTGYSTLIDRNGIQVKELKTLSLVALMSSPAYLWHVKVTQVYQVEIVDQDASLMKSKDLEDVDHLKGMKTPKLFSTNKLSEKLVVVDMNHGDTMSMSDENTTSEQLVFTDHDRETPEIEKTDFDSERNLNTNVSRIVNGVDTKVIDVPWQVSLRVVYSEDKYTVESIKTAVGVNCTYTEGVHFCGGSIVSDMIILTAAHCFLGSSKVQGMMDLTETKVIVGDTNRCNDGPNDYNSTQYDIESVTFHYAYDANIVDNDIAILKLKTKIEFKENIKPVRLAEHGSSFIGSPALVSGWGVTDLSETATGELPEILQSSDQFIIQNETYCSKYLDESMGSTEENVKKYVKYDHVYEGVFCTGSKTSSDGVFTGPGDSGGSLVVFDNNTEEYVQVGIVSYGLNYKPNSTKTVVIADEQSSTCAESYVDYFQSVPYFQPWIKLVMLQYT